MRIVVQNPRTGWYLHETGAWTSDVTQARDFLSSADAMKARQLQQVPEASLVFRFEREGYSITVPLEQLQTQAPPLPLAHEAVASPKQDMLTG